MFLVPAVKRKKKKKTASRCVSRMYIITMKTFEDQRQTKLSNIETALISLCLNFWNFESMFYKRIQKLNHTSHCCLTVVIDFVV